MARPTTARLRTAYDLGVEAAREGGREMPGNISAEPELAAAYDEGFGDESDRQEGKTKTRTAPAQHRATATAPRPAGRPAKAKPSRGSATRRVATSPGGWPRPTLRPSTSDGTGFLFGVLLYCLGLSYIRGGRDGVVDWLRAKFVNKARDGTYLP